MSNLSLTEMKQRAQRQLDGMTVNRDEMAQDVLKLAADRPVGPVAGA